MRSINRPHRIAVTAAMILTNVLAVCGPTNAAADKCALWVENARVCFVLGHASGCVALRPAKHADFERYRCLVRESHKIAGCKAVTVAQNTLIRFEPPGGTYEAFLFRNPSKEFYGEEQIQRSCRS